MWIGCVLITRRKGYEANLFEKMAVLMFETENNASRAKEDIWLQIPCHVAVSFLFVYLYAG